MYEKFDSWQKAFDTCRERNRPLQVSVWDIDLGVYVESKIFPSGYCEDRPILFVT